MPCRIRYNWELIGLSLDEKMDFVKRWVCREYWYTQARFPNSDCRCKGQLLTLVRQQIAISVFYAPQARDDFPFQCTPLAAF